MYLNVSPTCPHPDFPCVLPETVSIPFTAPPLSRAGPTLTPVPPGSLSHAEMNIPPAKETTCEGVKETFPGELRRASALHSAPQALLSCPARHHPPHRGKFGLSSQSGILFTGPFQTPFLFFLSSSSLSPKSPNVCALLSVPLTPSHPGDCFLVH